MALPASGAISLSAVAAQFGGGAPHSISEYYLGGPYIIPGTTGTPSGVRTLIPASGALSLNDFHGAPSFPVLTGIKTYQIASAPNSASGVPRYTTVQTARFTVNASGSIFLTADGRSTDTDGCATLYFAKNGGTIGSYGFCIGVNVFSLVVSVAVGDVITILMQEGDLDRSHYVANQQIWAGENQVGCITVG
jgi:hypothetical protein